MKLDLQSILKLPPDQRVRALQALEEELQQLIKKRNEEVKQSTAEIAAAEEMLARAHEEQTVLDQIAMPENDRAVRIDDLFFKDSKKERERKEQRAESEVKTRNLEENISDVAVLRQQQANLNYLTQPKAFDDVRTTYNDVPKNPLNEQQANAYVNTNQQIMDEARGAYIRHKEQERDVFTQYKK